MGTTTVERGVIAELSIQKHLIGLGMNCYAPVADVNQVDLLVEISEGVFSRVQIKGIYTNEKGDTTCSVNLRKHSANKIDVIGVYYCNNGKEIIAFLPYFGEEQFQLAISNAKNNQQEDRKWIYAYSEFPMFLANKRKYKNGK
tara:strand:- start:177 stop:605 length:429 start_codon:yes stop_codon:yes gene_type:complete